MALLEKPLNFMRSSNLWNCAFKEFFGSNLPHIALVMNRFEALDQAIVQFGNFSTVFLENTLLSHALGKLQAKLQPAIFSKQALNQISKSPTLLNQQLWGHIGKAAFLYTNMASYVIGAPSLRNGIMKRVSKTTNFIDMVGLNGDKKEDPDVIRSESTKDFKRFARIYGLGIGLASTLWAGSQLAARHKVPIPALLKGFHTKLGLKEGQYQHLKDWAAVLFWAYPTYLGFGLFARDKDEALETAIKAGGFSLAFVILPRTVEKFITKATVGKTFPLVGSGKNAAFLGQLLTGLLGYTAIPTLINLGLRRKNAARFGLLDITKAAKPPLATSPVITNQTPLPPDTRLNASSSLPRIQAPSPAVALPLFLANSKPQQGRPFLEPQWRLQATSPLFYSRLSISY